jgi:hypothetical protein
MAARRDDTVRHARDSSLAMRDVLDTPSRHQSDRQLLTFLQGEAAIPTLDGAEVRVRAARAFYQQAVAGYLAARTDRERSVLGDAMYFAQMATIEARFNPEGSARFRAMAEAKLGMETSPRVVADVARSVPVDAPSLADLPQAA